MLKDRRDASLPVIRRRALAVAVAAIIVVAAGAALAQVACPGFFPGGIPPALIKPSLRSRTTLLCNGAYASLASGVTHGALWSAEHPTTASLAAASVTARQGAFHPDERLPYADQGQLLDYRRSGFDRGHMTPSGDMPDEEAQQQSFSLANVVPQTARLNRGVWERIETAVRDRASQEGELYVVTGAYFDGAQQLQAIGPDNVLVPSGTWKALYDPQLRAGGAYLCDNTPAPACRTMSLAVMASTVGIDPFPALPLRIKQVTLALPQPGTRHRSYRRKQRTLLDQILGQ